LREDEGKVGMDKFDVSGTLSQASKRRRLKNRTPTAVVKSTCAKDGNRTRIRQIAAFNGVVQSALMQLYQDDPIIVQGTFKAEIQGQNGKIVIATLNGLLEISRDGEQGFRTCAEGVESPNLKALLEAAARRCAEGATELEAKIRNLGGEPAGSMHRAWTKRLILARFFRISRESFSYAPDFRKLFDGEDQARMVLHWLHEQGLLKGVSLLGSRRASRSIALPAFRMPSGLVIPPMASKKHERMHSSRSLCFLGRIFSSIARRAPA
jgi:hypothetical protein